MNEIAKFTLQNFRAVKSADIKLNGITVVSGENGCGKSTMSQLLYYVLKYANDFEDLVIPEVNEQLQAFVDVLQQLAYYIYRHNRLKSSVSNPGMFGKRMHLLHMEDIPSFQKQASLICDSFQEAFSEDMHLLSPRLKFMFLSILKNAKEEDTINILLEKMCKQINEILQKANLRFQSRSSSLLKKRIVEFFDTFPAFSLQEYGEIVIDSKIPSIPLLHNIKKVLYIDTPMVVGLEPTRDFPQHWFDLNKKLRESSHRGYSVKVNRFIKDDILNGDAYYDDKGFVPSLKFKRNDGMIIDLSECATGFRSFSAIQLLLKNRFLDKETMLILDEPEAHLHPQWIVDYARLLVLLNKVVGVKLFIASHSTDMVASLRYIAEKEGTLDSLSFYMAKEVDSNGKTYNFESLDNDIEPIFQSFNKSIDKLDRYV